MKLRIGPKLFAGYMVIALLLGVVGLVALQPLHVIEAANKTIIILTVALLLLAILLSKSRTVLEMQKAEIELKNIELAKSIELAKTMAFLDKIIKSTVDPIIVLDFDGRIHTLNPAAIHLLAYEGEEDLLNRTVGSFTKEEPLLFNPADFNRLIHKGVVENVEIPFHTKEGKKIPTLLSGSVLRDDQEKLLGVVLIAKDITEQKKVERMKDEFLGAVSHEFRTPLAIIKAAVSNLADGIAGELNPKQVELCQMAIKNSQRLSHLIEDLLDLSRFESNQLLIHHVRFSFPSLIDEIVTSFHMTLNGEKKLEMEVAESLPDVHADREMLTRVFTNLIQNAVRYAKEKVKVKAAILEGESKILVSVIDDGCGIPREEQCQLFNKFVQLHRPVGEVGYKGVGLGLAMCKNIVESHGGRIWVESEVNQGAAFCWTIPTSAVG